MLQRDLSDIRTERNRNLLYCSGRYNVTLNDSGIRLAGDEISQEEWIDPVAGRTDLPLIPDPKKTSPQSGS